GPQRHPPLRLAPAPLPRLRPTLRRGGQEGAGLRGAQAVDPPPAPGAAQPPRHRPRRGRLARLAAGVRQRPVPRGDALGAGAAQKKSGLLILEADEMWSFVGSRREVWWVWVALDGRARQVVGVVGGHRLEVHAPAPGWT